MDILFIRHSEAEDGPDDDRRALTKKGKTNFSKSVKRFYGSIPKIEKLISSPLIRAIQTAEIFASGTKKQKIIEIEELRSEVPPDDSLKRIAREAKGSEAVCCVGHEPNISSLVSYCLTKHDNQIVKMGKGAMALVSFDGPPDAGRGVLKWLFPM